MVGMVGKCILERVVVLSTLKLGLVDLKLGLVVLKLVLALLVGLNLLVVVVQWLHAVFQVRVR